jgi:RNA polymerase sigma-70 factor (ECF subfamily)
VLEHGFADPEAFARDLAAARSHGGEDLGRLLMQCRDYLLLVADRELGDDLRVKVAPSDVVQETFLEAQRDFGGFQGTTRAELLAWLGRVQKNNVINHTRAYRGAKMRSVGREVALAGGLADPEIACDTPSPSERFSAKEEATALTASLGRLPERYQHVLRLRHEHSMTFNQIGAALGCSAEAARKLWARAVDHLQRELPPYESR